MLGGPNITENVHSNISVILSSFSDHFYGREMSDQVGVFFAATKQQKSLSVSDVNDLHVQISLLCSSFQIGSGFVLLLQAKPF